MLWFQVFCTEINLPFNSIFPQTFWSSLLFAIYQIRHRILQMSVTKENAYNCAPLERFASIAKGFKCCFQRKRWQPCPGRVITTPFFIDPHSTVGFPPAALHWDPASGPVCSLPLTTFPAGGLSHSQRIKRIGSWQIRLCSYEGAWAGGEATGQEPKVGVTPEPMALHWIVASV